MTFSNHLHALVEDFAVLEQVDAILLGGSHGAGRASQDSDYDLYIYLNQPLSLELRRQITDKHCRYMELNNQFWETEDDGVLKDGIEIELIYRDLGWLEAEVSRVVEQHQVGVGYSTCFWTNLLDSIILYEREGVATALQQRFRISYPRALQQAIVDKCFPLLKQAMPAYYQQLSKAQQRQDLVSLNHRCAEFLAAYFDILFALNRIPHPGEKRMMELAAVGELQPPGWQQQVRQLLKQAALGESQLLITVDDLVAGLRTILEQQKLI